MAFSNVIGWVDPYLLSILWQQNSFRLPWIWRTRGIYKTTAAIISSTEMTHNVNVNIMIPMVTRFKGFKSLKFQNSKSSSYVPSDLFRLDFVKTVMRMMPLITCLGPSASISLFQPKCICGKKKS